MYISYKSRKYLIRAGSGGLGWGPPPRKIQTHQIHTVKLPKIGLVTPSDKQNYLLEPPPHLQRKNNLICVCSYVNSETAWYKSY